MKKLLRNTILTLFGSLKNVGSGVHVLNSHYISREDLDPELFSDLLGKIKLHADFLRIQEAIELISEKKRIKDRFVSFTFDDGYEECYTKIAPVLKEYKTNAAYFINPGFVNGDKNYQDHFLKHAVHVKGKAPMSWEMIRELHQEGSVIGNHTNDHVRLVGLNEDQLKKQIIESKQTIEGEIGAKCDHFAWTYGGNTDIDQRSLNLALEEHKYVFGGDNYKKYYSFDDRIINRRHIEGDWPFSHVKFFLSHEKEF